MIQIKIKGEFVVSYWPPKTYPRPSESPAPRRDICPLMRGDW